MDTVQTPEYPCGNKDERRPHSLNGHDVVKGEDNYLIPFQTGFRREVVFDHKGERMNIYYINGKTRLASRPAMERYLKDNLAVGLSTCNFCWQKVILGLDNPERETIRKANPRNRYSSARSTPQMGTPPQPAFSDDSTPMARVAIMTDQTTCHRATGHPVLR